jgi:hypothetical protein
MLTVETDMNVDSKRTNERGSLLVGSLVVSCPYKRFCPALAALVGPIQNFLIADFKLIEPLIWCDIVDDSVKCVQLKYTEIHPWGGAPRPPPPRAPPPE